MLRVRDNFGGRTPKWVGAEMSKVGLNYERKLRKGETVEATLEPLQAVPPKPKDAYSPIDPAPVK